MKIAGKRVFLLIIAGTLMISVLGNLFFWQKNVVLNIEKNNQILKSDSILSSKLLLNKQFDDAWKEYGRLKRKNDILKKEVEETIFELKERIVSLEKLTYENNAVQGLGKRLSQFITDKTDLMERIDLLLSERKTLISNIESLNNFNTSLKKENELLVEKIRKAKGIKAYNLTVHTYALRKNNIPVETHRAGKVERIAVMFDISENILADTGNKNVYLVIKDTEGNTIGSKNTFASLGKHSGKTYSSEKVIEYKNETQKVTFDFDYNKKLLKGKYKTEIYIEEMLAGNAEFMLR